MVGQQCATNMYDDIEALCAALLCIRCAADVSLMRRSEARAGALGGVLPYGPQVTDRCLSAAGLQPLARISDVSPDEQQLDALRGAVAGYQAWVASLDDKLPAGTIGLAKAGTSCQAGMHSKGQRLLTAGSGCTDSIALSTWILNLDIHVVSTAALRPEQNGCQL